MTSVVSGWISVLTSISCIVIYGILGGSKGTEGIVSGSAVTIYREPYIIC